MHAKVMHSADSKDTPLAVSIPISNLSDTARGKEKAVRNHTVHGILRTLAAHGMVEQEPGSVRYMLGPAVLRLSSVYLDSLEFRSRTVKWAEELARRSGVDLDRRAANLIVRARAVGWLLSVVGVGPEREWKHGALGWDVPNDGRLESVRSYVRRSIDEFTGKPFTFFQDPDGLPLELYER